MTRLEVSGGSIFVSMCGVSQFIDDEPQETDVWMMEYGVASSWSRLYAVCVPLYRQSVVFSTNGEEVLIQHGTVGKELAWYDIKNK